MTLYGLHGLRIRSEVPLSGFALGGGDADVDVRWGAPGPVAAEAPPGRVVAARTTDHGYWYVASEDGGEITLRVPAVCDFVIPAGAASVECRPDPTVDPMFVGVLVGGLVVAFLLGLGGDIVLHASAVEVDGTVIALAGGSGAGKSTLAAVLCAAGAGLVTDDLLRVAPGAAGDPVRCVGGAPQLRLRPHAAWAMNAFGTPPQVSRTADDRLGLEPSTAAHLSLPLSTIALVQPARSAGGVVIEDITGGSALLRLMSTLRIAGWQDPALLRAHFEALARVAEGVRVVEAAVPWGPPLPAGVAPALLSLAGR